VPLLVALLVAHTYQQREAPQQDVGGQAVVAVARPGRSEQQQQTGSPLGKPLRMMCSILAAHEDMRLL
jgi:hypothetical protein